MFQTVRNMLVETDIDDYKTITLCDEVYHSFDLVTDTKVVASIHCREEFVVAITNLLENRTVKTPSGYNPKTQMHEIVFDTYARKHIKSLADAPVSQKFYQRIEKDINKISHIVKDPPNNNYTFTVITV